MRPIRDEHERKPFRPGPALAVLLLAAAGGLAFAIPFAVTQSALAALAVAAAFLAAFIATIRRLRRFASLDAWNSFQPRRRDGIVFAGAGAGGVVIAGLGPFPRAVIGALLAALLLGLFAHLLTALVRRSTLGRH